MPQFSVSRDGKQIQLDLHVDAQALTLCAHAPRAFSYTGTRPRDWLLQYYRMFIEHPSTLRMAREVVSALEREEHLPEEQLKWLVAWVQEGIAYDFARASGPMNDGLQYPLETVAKGKGVCADKSLLLAAVLMEMGFGVCLFTFERANHMAVGIEVPAGFGAYGSGFAFIETTDARPIGVIPDKMMGGVRLDGRPEQIVLRQGKKFEAIKGIQEAMQAGVKEFGKDFLHMNATQQELKRQMQEIQGRMDKLKPQLNGCRGTLPPDKYQACHRLNEEYNGLVAQYNALVGKFNAGNG